MSDIASYFRELDLDDTASREEVRTAYKRLILQIHPDKVNIKNQKKFAARFIMVHEAYTRCLDYLLTAKVQAEDEVEDYSDWRGQLPYGILGFTVPWWNELKGDEPEPVKRWAVVCAKSQRNAGAKMTDTERWILAYEYFTAYQDFEEWRYIHLERHDEDDRLQAEINKMKPAAREKARADLDAKRSAPDYKAYNGCYDETREPVFYGEHIPTNHWTKLAPEQRLRNHRDNVAAIEQRETALAALAAEHGVKHLSRSSKRSKAKQRMWTEERILQELKEKEKNKFEDNMVKKMLHAKKGGWSITDMHGVQNPALLEPRAEPPPCTCPKYKG